MKKFLFLLTLIFVLPLTGCTQGNYTQAQVDDLIKQQKAADQAKIDNLNQQINELQTQVTSVMFPAKSWTPPVASSTATSTIEEVATTTELIIKATSTNSFTTSTKSLK